MEKIENDSGTNSFDSIFARLDPNSQAKIVCGVRHREPLDEEEDFFEIGLARVHGFLEDDSLNLTEAEKQRLLQMFMDFTEGKEDNEEENYEADNT